VLIPEENAKDLQDIPENVKNGLEIVPVRWIDKVLEIALERMPVPLPETMSSGCARRPVAGVPAPSACQASIEAFDAACRSGMKKVIIFGLQQTK
jgi:ATP-dependent Lon protease